MESGTNEMIFIEDISGFASKIQNYGSIAAIDCGLSNVGIAVSDETMSVVIPVDIVSPFCIVDTIGNYIRRFNLCGVVIGLAKTEDGYSTHPIHKIAILIAHSIVKRFNIPILFWDERFSTVGANIELDYHYKRGIYTNKRSRKKKSINILDDSHAAKFILDGVIGLIKKNIEERL